MSQKYTENKPEKEFQNKEYEYGFYLNIESDKYPIELNESIPLPQ
jgi:Fe-S cluster assembly protein SufB